MERAPSDVELIVTTRDYTELNKFLRQIKLRAISFGKHGGQFAIDKLVASVERTKELIAFVQKQEFDCSFSYISPEAARVSFGLGLSHYICSDSPHANAPCRLAIPLSRKVFSPFPIQKYRWTQYGIKPSEVMPYHALDPWVWLSSSRVKVRNGKNLVLVRLEESFASYVKPGAGVSKVLGDLISAIKSCGDFEIFVIPRYDEQRAWAKEKFGNLCTVPDGTVEGVELISKADLIIGGGGTMTQEAALIGVPNISYFPSSKLDVFENYYFPKKLSIRASTPKELISKVPRMLSNIDETRAQFRIRAEKAVSQFEDPIKFIFERILGVGS
jgi:predicted glycosyltransferase